jgi:hypothetical protein
VFETDDGRKIDVPEGLTLEEERAVLMALERYFVAENPKPAPWVLQGRIEATGYGALQVRRFAREPWHGSSRARASRRSTGGATFGDGVLGHADRSRDAAP